MTKPTIVFIPSLCHTPEHFEPFMQLLRAEGFPTKCARLPSVDPDDALEQSLSRDAEYIRRDVLMPELEDGIEIILVMHAYGAAPGAAAARGLSKRARVFEGRSGGIIGLIYVAGLILQEGQLPYELIRIGLPDIPYNEETSQIEITEELAMTFFRDIAREEEDCELLDMACRSLRPHSFAPVVSPSPAPESMSGEYTYGRAYLMITQDALIPLRVQSNMMRRGNPHWLLTAELDSDHFPFLSQQELLGDFLEMCIGEMVARRTAWGW